MVAPKAPGSALVARYRTTLTAISARTGTAMPSLITSFVVLHEATAVGPLVGVFFAAKSLGVGERVIDFVRADDAPDGAVWRTCRTWVVEGEQWVGRVGRRYGIWGFEKGAPRGSNDGLECASDSRSDSEQKDAGSTRIAGDVANAVVAYGVTKALLPLRVALSLYLAPRFSRQVLDPLSSRVLRVFRK